MKTSILAVLLILSTITIPALAISGGGGGGGFIQEESIYKEENFTTQASITNGVEIGLAFTVPVTVKQAPVMRIRWKTGTAGVLQLLEGCSWNSGSGVPRWAVNTDFTSAVKSELLGIEKGQMIIDPEGVTGGIQKIDERFYAPDKDESINIVLQPGQTYAITWMNTSGSLGGCQIACDWTEYKNR